MKLCYKLIISYLRDILELQLCRMSSFHCYKWLFGAENLSGISRNALQVWVTFQQGEFSFNMVQGNAKIVA